MPEFFAQWGEPIPERGSTSTLTAREYCPTCEPDVNPLQSCVSVVYCFRHIPSTDGQVKMTFPPITYAEAGGDSNRAACAFFHRSKESPHA